MPGSQLDYRAFFWFHFHMGFNQSSWRLDVKVMVGGAPITQEFADTIGADAYTPDAASEAKKAKELAA